MIITKFYYKNLFNLIVLHIILINLKTSFNILII